MPKLVVPIFRAPLRSLGELLDHGMVRKDKMRAAADDQAVSEGDAERLERSGLFYEGRRTEGDTVADDAQLAGMEDAGRIR